MERKPNNRRRSHETFRVGGALIPSRYSKPEASAREVPSSSSLTLFEVALFSHEVAAARSCGRQPADVNTHKPKAPKGAKASNDNKCAAAASRLSNLLRAFSRGLTPTATCYRPFGTPEMRNFKTDAWGFDEQSAAGCPSHLFRHQSHGASGLGMGNSWSLAPTAVGLGLSDPATEANAVASCGSPAAGIAACTSRTWSEVNSNPWR